MVSRRGFLGGLAGILTAGVAPAIVREPMKIFVPKEKHILASECYPNKIVWAPKSPQEIQAELVKIIQDTCEKMYLESGYKAAAEAVGGIVPMYSTVTDTKIIRYLQLTPAVDYA